MRLRLAAAMLLLAAALPALAAGLQVSPTTVDLAPGRASAGLELRNAGDRALHAQVRVFAWRVDGDRDVLEPTAAIVASPPILRLDPGATQLVRIVRAGDAPADGREAAYRVIVDELPDDGAPPRDDGLRFVLRYSIPVFLQPVGGRPTAPVLDTRIEAGAPTRRVVLANGGDGRAQVADLAWIDAAGGRHPIAAGLAGYVLPGTRRGWDLPPGLRGGRIVARINGETAERTLAADPDPR